MQLPEQQGGWDKMAIKRPIPVMRAKRDYGEGKQFEKGVRPSNIYSAGVLSSLMAGYTKGSLST